MANASVKTAAIVNPGDLRNTRRLKRSILDESLDEIAAERFVAFLFEPFVAAELDARAPFGLGAGETGTFQIIRAMLDVRAQLLLHVIVDLRTMEELRGERSEARRGISYFLRLSGERGCDGGRQPIPAIGFFSQTLAAGGGEFVELGPAIVLRCAPARLQQSLPDEAKQAGIKRALFNQQRVAGDLPDAQKDAVTMQRAE